MMTCLTVCCLKIRTEARRLQNLLDAAEERKRVLHKLEEIDLLKRQKESSKRQFFNPLGDPGFAEEDATISQLDQAHLGSQQLVENDDAQSTDQRPTTNVASIPSADPEFAKEDATINQLDQAQMERSQRLNKNGEHAADDASTDQGHPKINLPDCQS